MFIMHKLPASPAVISSSGCAHVLFMILTAISSNFEGLLAARAPVSHRVGGGGDGEDNKDCRRCVYDAVS